MYSDVKHPDAERVPQSPIVISARELAEIHRLLRLVFDRKPSRELRQAIRLLEQALPPELRTYDRAQSPRHRPT